MPSSRYPTVEEETWVAASPHTQWSFSESLASHRFLRVSLNLVYVCVCTHTHKCAHAWSHAHLESEGR